MTLRIQLMTHAAQKVWNDFDDELREYVASHLAVQFRTRSCDVHDLSLEGGAVEVAVAVRDSLRVIRIDLPARLLGPIRMQAEWDAAVSAYAEQLSTSVELVTEPTVSATAEFLAGISVSILPSCHRQRYAAELRGELHDVAESGSRLAQIAYGARVITRSFALRRALRERSLQISVKLKLAVGYVIGLGAAVSTNSDVGLLVLAGVTFVGLCFFAMWTVSDSDRTNRVIQVLDAIRRLLVRDR